MTLKRFISALSVCVLAISCQSKTKHESPHGSGKAKSSSFERTNSILTSSRQLIFEGRRSGEGYFSADGSHMIFQSERVKGNPFYQMFIKNLSTGQTHRVSNGIGATTCGWIHPNNKKVLFSSTHGDRNARKKMRAEIKLRASGKQKRYSWDFEENYEIYSTDWKGKRFTNLTRKKGYDAEASYSPNGKSIVFASNRGGYAKSISAKEKEIFKKDQSYFMDLYSMDADGKNVRQLTKSKGYDGGPFYSADGKLITWRRFDTSGRIAEVYVMNADGSNQRQVTRLGKMSWAPYFHPSGDYLIFATNIHGHRNFELYIVDTIGKAKPVRVTFSEGFDGLPVFSPDGQSLAWSSQRTAGGQSQLFTAKWDDAQARKSLGLPMRKTSTPKLGQFHPEFREQDMRQHIEYLASEKMAGRLIGSAEEEVYTSYLAKFFKSLGLEPAGDKGSYFQTFEFTSGAQLGKKNVLTGSALPKSTVVGKDWTPVTYSKSGQVKEAEIVFTGYGIVAPKVGHLKEYNSYSNLEVKDKWVMAFRYAPEDVKEEQRSHLLRYGTLRNKVMMARERGAKGIIFVSGPNSKVKKQLISMDSDGQWGGSSLGVISVTDRFAQELFARAGKKLKDIQNRLDKGENVAGFVMPGTKLGAELDIKFEKKKARNVIARLKVSGAKGSVIIGAHGDHLGTGHGMNSLARSGEENTVHYGADDNASGVAGVLEIAHHFVQKSRDKNHGLKKNIVFTIWSGEEVGLLGSNHYVSKLTKGAKNRVHAYVNMDMIGRLDKSLILQGTGSSSIWEKEIEKEALWFPHPMITQKDPYLPTDSTTFYLQGIPTLSAFTGAHIDYHTPRDIAARVKVPEATHVAQLLYNISETVATRSAKPNYIKVKRAWKGTKGRKKYRIYLGTIPDYAREGGKGLRISGVVKGGPAEKAGLKAGDVIIKFGTHNVKNIYDYTYSLQAARIGKATPVLVLRGEEKVELSVVPTSRE